jgi:hypothetical protein
MVDAGFRHSREHLMSELTRGRGGRLGFLGLALALAVALVAVVLQGTATGTSHLDVTENAGILLLSTGPQASDNYIEYYADADLDGAGGTADLGALTASRGIETNRRCDVTDFNVVDLQGETDGSLLTLLDNGSRSYSGLVSNGFGVKTKNNCSTSQGRIGPGQLLTLSLGDYFGDSVAINVLEVDVEGKFNAKLSVSLNDELSFTEPLPDGDSDNGPDSGASDNTLVTIGGDGIIDFDTVTFGPAGPDSAEVSIEGGGDGTVTGGYLRGHFGVNQTLFQLVSTEAWDGILNCDESVATVGDPGEAATDVAITRLSNKDGSCGALVLYNLDIDGTSVLFDPDLSVEDDAQFLVQVDWAPYADPFSPPHRQISLAGDGSDYQDVIACESLEQGAAPNPDNPDPADTIVNPDGVLWCLAGQQQNLLSEITPPAELAPWQQVQWYHGGGDPLWK